METVAQTGVWAVKERAQILLPFSIGDKNIVEGGALSYESTPRDGQGEESKSGEGVGGLEVLVGPPRRLWGTEAERERLLVALETAEVFMYVRY